MRKFLIALTFIGWVNGVTAQTNVLTLSDAQRIALAHNWDLLAAKSSVDAATAQLLIAKEFPNPNLSAATAKIGNYENDTSAGNGIWARSYDTIFAVNQLFEIGGKRRDRQAAARANVLGAQARFWDAKRQLDDGVTKTYVAALLANENARLLRESAGYMQHEQEIAEARFHAGDLADADLKQIQVAAGQYILQANAAEAAAVQARIALEVLLGNRAPHGDWQAGDSLEQISGEISPLPEIKTNARRPDVLAAETDLRAAEGNLKLQKAGRIPDPTIALQYEHNPPGGGPAADTVGLGVSFPLPIWNQNKGNIDAAKASVAQARMALEKLRAQAAADLAVAEISFREASARLQRYRAEIRPRANSARESVIFKFNKGGAALVDLLAAERTDNDVRIATAQAMADTISAAADLASAKTALTAAQVAAEK